MSGIRVRFSRVEVCVTGGGKGRLLIMCYFAMKRTEVVELKTCMPKLNSQCLKMTEF